MTQRQPRTVRVDPDVWSGFVEQVIEWEGQKNGELGRHVENALEEYVDRDRFARIEEKLDTLIEHTDATHTHMDNPTAEKTDEIASNLSATGQTVIPDDDVVRAIEKIAGSDPRTVSKYKTQLQRRGLAYSHPTGTVWTTDREQFVSWVDGVADNDPSTDIMDVLDPYPMTFDDYDREVTTIEP